MSASGPKPDLRQTAHHVADRAKVSAGWKAIMALATAMGGILFHPPPVLLIGEEGRRMRGSLGEKIGEGVSADIHAWASGQVVKLFKAGVPQRIGRREARMTRAVFAAGGPAPEVLDVVTEGALRHRAGPPRRTVRASGRDPRLALPVRAQDAPAAGRRSSARLSGGLIAALRRRWSPTCRSPASTSSSGGDECSAGSADPADGSGPAPAGLNLAHMANPFNYFVGVGR